ncbi:Microtubule-associated protein, microtubule dynamics during spindle orientation, partial [Kappamyces sp. JEL0680]
NFQVMNGMIAVMQLVAHPSKGFDRGCAMLIASGLVDKLGDSKLRKASVACLDAVASCSSLETVIAESFAPIKAMKAPKIIAEALAWMGQAIQDFGVAGLKLKELVAFLKDFLSNASLPVRSAAISVLASIRRFKPEVRDLLNDVSPSVQGQIDAEFAKVATMTVAAPVKVQAMAPVTTETNLLGDRVDLMSVVATPLIEQLNNPNWKERKAALEELSAIIEKTNCNLQPVIGSDLVAAFKSRLGDSNKIISTMAVDVLGKLAKSIGKPIDRYLRTFLPPMLAQLSDQKSSVRNTVLVNFSKTVDIAGFAPAAPCVIASLSIDQPQVRKDLLNWISENPIPVNADN